MSFIQTLWPNINKLQTHIFLLQLHTHPCLYMSHFLSSATGHTASFPHLCVDQGYLVIHCYPLMGRCKGILGESQDGTTTCKICDKLFKPAWFPYLAASTTQLSIIMYLPPKFPTFHYIVVYGGAINRQDSTIDVYTCLLATAPRMWPCNVNISSVCIIKSGIPMEDLALVSVWEVFRWEDSGSIDLCARMPGRTSVASAASPHTILINRTSIVSCFPT